MLVVLSPLLVIAVTFNVWSSEREAGTWDLVRSQPVSELLVLGVKFALRTLVAWLPLVLLQGLATLAFDLPIDGQWWAVAGSVLLYVVFWVVASMAVAALRQSSEVNILLLLGVWIVCAVLGAAPVAVAAAARFALPEAMELTVLAREGYHSTWIVRSRKQWPRFYDRYPEWRSAQRFRAIVFERLVYAMQQRGDDAAGPAAVRYRQGLVDRERWGRVSCVSAGGAPADAHAHRADRSRRLPRGTRFRGRVPRDAEAAFLPGDLRRDTLAYRELDHHAGSSLSRLRKHYACGKGLPAFRSIHGRTITRRNATHATMIQSSSEPFPFALMRLRRRRDPRGVKEGRCDRGTASPVSRTFIPK